MVTNENNMVFIINKKIINKKLSLKLPKKYIITIFKKPFKAFAK